MCKDEARHGKAFLGLLERYLGEYKNKIYKSIGYVFISHTYKKVFRCNL